MTQLLGLPLETALELLELRGLPRPQVVYTAAPKGARETGTWRVVAVREGSLTAARFWDAMPQQAQA